MDWKYKHFASEMTFSASRAEVIEAARNYVSASLGWPLVETVDGLETKGYSFAHAATAKFHLTASTNGTKVGVELAVERASTLGFMLFDVGGYYNRQIRKWLEGIQWQLQHKSFLPTSQQPLTQVKPPQAWPTRFFGKFLYLLVASWLIILLLSFLVLPLVGLITGHLYIPGRGSGGITLHGAWARIISALILMLTTFILWKSKKRRQVSIKR